MECLWCIIDRVSKVFDLVYDYLSNGKQRVKTNETFSY